MTANLQVLESLLSELSEVGALLEEKGITSAPSLTPLVAKAQTHGIRISSEANLDDLRAAVEAACGRLKNRGIGLETSARPISTEEILGNTSGIPGEGP